MQIGFSLRALGSHAVDLKDDIEERLQFFKLTHPCAETNCKGDVCSIAFVYLFSGFKSLPHSTCDPGLVSGFVLVTAPEF